MKMKMLKNLN